MILLLTFPARYLFINYYFFSLVNNLKVLIFKVIVRRQIYFIMTSSSIFNLGNLISRAHFIVSILLHQQEEEEPLPPHPLQNGTARDTDRTLMTSPTSLAPPMELSPPSGGGGNNKSSTLSPMMPKKLQNSEKGFKGFSRRLSKRGKIWISKPFTTPKNSIIGIYSFNFNLHCSTVWL